MIDHLGLDVSDYRRSKDFYLAALGPLGCELLREFDGRIGGFAATASRSSGSARVSRRPASTSPSPRPTLQPSLRSTRRRSAREARTTARPACASATTPAITAPSSTIRMDSFWCAGSVMRAGIAD